MRLIGSISQEKDAKLFSDYLYAMGIKNEKRPGEGDSSWDVWVYNDEHLDQAKMMLNEFLRLPDSPEYTQKASIARIKRQQEQEDLKQFQKRVFTKNQIFPDLDRMGTVTIALITISILVAIISKLGANPSNIRYLFISEYFAGFLHEVFHGQIWRLVTPIFIHFGILHILFNMLWLRDLGSMIEKRQSPYTLAVLVIGIACVSNIGQYMMSGPLFGGMSGVVYGLLGYIWIRGKYDPASGLFVHPQTVTMMIVWFFICLVGLIGHVANTAHGVGLAVGIAWGYISAMASVSKRIKRK